MNAGEGRSHLRRSFLVVPGSEEKKLAKAPSLGADAVDTISLNIQDQEGHDPLNL